MMRKMSKKEESDSDEDGFKPIKAKKKLDTSDNGLLS